jgi:hypothetical protein
MDSSGEEEYVRAWASEVEDTTRVMVEKGLFGSRWADLPPILRRLREAWTSLKEGRVPAAREQLGLAEGELSRLIHERSQGWRAINVHELHLLAFHVAVAALLLNVATGWWIFGRVSPNILGVPKSIYLLGALGGTLRGLYWLHQKVQMRAFRVHFTTSHLAAPLLGALFALLVYVILRGGLVALGGDGSPSLGSFGMPAMALVAGFSWEWAMEKLNPLLSASSVLGAAARKSASGTAPAAEVAETTEEAAPSSRVAAARIPPPPTQPTGRYHAPPPAPARPSPSIP